MEAFSLLKYWRGGGGVVVGGGDSCVTSHSTTVITAVAQQAVELTEDEDDEDDDGPFFDLEFSVPADQDEVEVEEEDDKKQNNGAGFELENDDVESVDDTEDDEGEEREFKFTLSSGSSNDRSDQNLALSPSDDLFFKGRLVPIEPPSLVLNDSEPNLKPQFPASFLKSATKFRVFMLGFKRSKMNAMEKAANVKATEANESAASPNSPKKQQQNQEKVEETNAKQSKFFTVKFKVEEVPIVSLFTRENSKGTGKSQKQRNTEESASGSDEKRFSKDVMQKYLKKVKPLYVRVSKRYGEKLRFSGQLSLGSGLKAAAPSATPAPPPTAAAAQKSSPPKSTTATEKSQAETEIADAPSASNAKNTKQGNLPAGLRVVCKHLGKSRSASSAVAAVPPSAPEMSRRRDDSLLQQQDGIQSAILHCKKSFNASRDSDSSQLSRSVSDPSHEKSVESSKKTAEEGKVSPL